QDGRFICKASISPSFTDQAPKWVARTVFPACRPKPLSSQYKRQTHTATTDNTKNGSSKTLYLWPPL
ncbi:unnamed protein product, partial [Aphanomyces euteiches]